MSTELPISDAACIFVTAIQEDPVTGDMEVPEEYGDYYAVYASRHADPRTTDAETDGDNFFLAPRESSKKEAVDRGRKIAREHRLNFQCRVDLPEEEPPEELCAGALVTLATGEEGEVLALHRDKTCDVYIVDPLGRYRDLTRAHPFVKIGVPYRNVDQIRGMAENPVEL